MNVYLRSFGEGVPKEYAISILVISTDTYCELLFNALHNETRIKGDRYKLQVHTCGNVEHILQSSKNVHVDYVVFFLDVTRRTCLHEVDLNISRLDRSFLCGRICFVRESDIRPVDMAVSINAIWELRKKYDVQLLIGTFRNKLTSSFLAQRILTLVSGSLGMKSGVPYIDSPKRNEEVESVTQAPSSSEKIN